MSIRSWLQNLKSTCGLGTGRRTLRRSPCRQPAARPRLQLEALEDRYFFSTFTVLNTLDGVAGSLREAVIAANAHPGADTIVVPAGTYKLTLAGPGEDRAATGDLDITGDLKIKGAGAGSTIIDGAGQDRVFQVFGANAAISGVTIQGGVADQGGGIDAEGGSSLTIDHSTISGNSAYYDDGGNGDGGGIDASYETALTVEDSTISDNSSAEFGGGIFAGTALTVEHSTISGNSAGAAGGIAAEGATTVTVDHSTISDNSAGYGGGIVAEGGIQRR